ncbi:MAG: 30S ribosomal protein S1 [Microgenomates group bacterium]
MKRKINSAKPKKSSSEPQTMEELLASVNYQFPTLTIGQEVEGIITEKNKGGIYIDIGGKREGVVLNKEMKLLADFIKDLKVGDKIKAIVVQPENDKGQTLLSLKNAVLDQVWQEMEEKLKTGETVKVKGLQVNKGGLLVEIKGLQGFIPVSQFSSSYLEKIEKLPGKQIEVKVIEVDKEKNRLVFSEKAVSEAEILEQQKKVLKKIKKENLVEGEIVNIMPFGYFVKVTLPQEDIVLDGFVHISEISWEKVDDPSKFYKQGEKLKFKVLGVDEKTGRLNLSIKRLFPDPWEGIENKYPPDAKVKGVITKIAPFGLLVNLEPGIEGLVHISKIPVEKKFKEGEKIDCFVEFLDKENRRLSLGLVLTEKPIGYK